MDSQIEALTASDAYLETVYLNAEENLKKLIGLILKQRLRVPFPAETGAEIDPSARRAPAILRTLARLPAGTSKERLGFLNALRAAGEIAPDEAVDFWDGKELRQVQTIATEIHRESESSDLPDDLHGILQESLLLHRAGRYEESEARLNAILERIPDHRIALGNLAAIRTIQNRGREAQEILRRVIAAHPDYLIARCNLAVMLIEEGELDQADALLDGLSQRPRLHVQEVFDLYGAMAMLNRARGNDTAADGLMATLEGMVEDEDDARRLVRARRASLGSPPEGV